MLTFLILPILVCGIIWIQSDPKQSFKVSTYQGWLVYLHAAKFGSILVIASYIFIELILGGFLNWIIGLIPELETRNRVTPINILSYIMISSLPTELRNPPEGSTQALYSTVEILAVSLLSVASTYSLTVLLNSLWSREEFRMFYLKRFWRKHSIFDFFILKTMQKGDFMQVTLENNKCYVGIVSQIQEPKEETTGHKHISLTPVLSGYRHSETQSIIFTNRYPKNPKRDIINYNDAIIVPIDKIISISGFDIKIFNDTADNLIITDDKPIANKPSIT